MDKETREGAHDEKRSGRRDRLAFVLLCLALAFQHTCGEGNGRTHPDNVDAAALFRDPHVFVGCATERNHGVWATCNTSPLISTRVRIAQAENEAFVAEIPIIVAMLSTGPASSEAIDSVFLMVMTVFEKNKVGGYRAQERRYFSALHDLEGGMLRMELTKYVAPGSYLVVFELFDASMGISFEDAFLSYREINWHVTDRQAPLSNLSMSPGQTSMGSAPVLDSSEMPLSRESQVDPLHLADDEADAAPKKANASNVNDNGRNESCLLLGVYHDKADLPAAETASPGGISDRKWSVLLSLSSDFVDMFENWLHFYHLLSLDMTVVLVAEDHATFIKYKDRSDVETQCGRGCREFGEAGFSYDTPGYRGLVSHRAAYILQALQKYSSVIYSDVDTVWLADPRPFFTGNGTDIWMSVDENVSVTLSSAAHTQAVKRHPAAARHDARAAEQASQGPNASFILCTGFMAILRTRGTVSLMQAWDCELTMAPQLNQPLLNHLIQQMNQSVTVSRLDRQLFPSGDLFFGTEGVVAERGDLTSKRGAGAFVPKP